MHDEDVPILVVGGGPVGLSTALELDHHGVAVMLLEPRRFVEHSRPRAKTTSARTMEHFRRWGVAKTLRARAPIPPTWSSRVTFSDTVLGAEATHLESCLGLRTAPAVSTETAQQVSQGIVEEVLRDAIAQRPGIDARYGWRVTGIEQSPTHALATAIDDKGQLRTVRSAWTVGADGPRSIVRAAMQTAYVQRSDGSTNLNLTFRALGLSARLSKRPSIQHWLLNRGAPGVLGPLDLSDTWWAIATGAPAVTDDGSATRLLHAMIGAPVSVDIIATDPWRARMCLADDYRDGRLFIVGDSAHQNPPWGGHGYNTGVGDAVNLGWKLAAVTKGWAPEELLDSYTRERRPVEQATIDLATANMGSLPRELDEAGRGDAGESIRRQKAPEFYADGLVFGYGYSPLSHRQSPTSMAYEPLAEPGNRLFQSWIGGRPIHDLLGREFSVVGSASACAPLLRAGQALSIPITHVRAPGGPLLVRPDQHIAFAGPSSAQPQQILLDALHGLPGAHGKDLRK